MKRAAWVTLGLASLPVAVPWAVVTLSQPPPRVRSAPPPLPEGERADVLVVLAPGDPSWPERPAEPDARSAPSPVIYNTEIIAREVGDELAARGITVRVLPSDQAKGAADVLGHRLVIFALPARRFQPGAGFQRFLDGPWEEAVRDYPAETARSRFAGLVISATEPWGEAALGALEAAVEPVAARLADRAVFLTSLTGADVVRLRDAFAARLAGLAAPEEAQP